MELEEIHRLVETAEESHDYLLHDAAQYGEQLTYFYHTEGDYCQLDEGYAVSKSRMVEEAREMARTIDYHEEMLSRLRDARGKVPETADFRVLKDDMDARGYEQRIDELVQSYEEVFESVMEVCSRAQLDPDLPDPIMMRSVDRMEDQGFDGDLDVLLT